MLPHFSDLLLRMIIVENTCESYSPLGIEWGSLGTGEQSHELTGAWCTGDDFMLSRHKIVYAKDVFETLPPVFE